MSKTIDQSTAAIQDLKSILKCPTFPSIEIYSHEEVVQIIENWIEIQCFNLNKEDGVDPDDNLEYPWATLFGSRNKGSQTLLSFFVLTYAEEGYFLYSFSSIETAIELVRDMRDKISNIIKNPSI